MTNWYRDCSPKERRAWYSDVAEAYEQTRPTYPPQLIDRAVKLALSSQDARILEIGCGPGTATKDFAKLGYSMVAVEPSIRACELARQNCLPYPQVEIINTTFEEWPLRSQKFDAILAATSFHWVSPEIVCEKIAAALKDNGFLILLWNTPPQPSYETHQQLLHKVYQDLAPSLGKYENKEIHLRNVKGISKNITESGTFQEINSEHLVTDVTYSIDDYLALSSTLSPYIALEAQQRSDLFTRLKMVLGESLGSSIKLKFLSILQVMQLQDLEI